MSHQSSLDKFLLPPKQKVGERANGEEMSSHAKHTLSKAVSSFGEVVHGHGHGLSKRKIQDENESDTLHSDDRSEKRTKVVDEEVDEEKTPPYSFEASEVDKTPPLLPATFDEEDDNNEQSKLPESFKKFVAPKQVVIQAELSKKNQMSRSSTTPVFKSTDHSFSKEKETLHTRRIDLKTTDNGESYEIKDELTERTVNISKSEQQDSPDDSSEDEDQIETEDRSESVLVHQYQTPTGQLIQVRQGDITAEDTDAIVNAANEYLAHGGGVAGAVSRAGGPAIQRESNQWVKKFGEVPTGQVAVTGPGNMICRCVIHAVGPVWHGGEDDERKYLTQAVYNSLKKANELKAESISIPAISSGIFGFPKDLCAELMFLAALAFCKRFPTTSVKQIRFTNFDRPTVKIFSAEFIKRFGDEK